MLFVSLIRWWYVSGWLDQLRLVRNRFDRAADFYSIELSARSLFKPFRQIDADQVRKGSLDVVIRSMFDQLFSRVFGAIVRTLLIFIGCIGIFFEAILGCLRLLFWPVVPLLPLLLLPVSMSGWIPWL